jgi:cytochrome c2
MVFAGIKNDQEINDLWAYLKQFDANGNIKK